MSRVRSREAATCAARRNRAPWLPTCCKGDCKWLAGQGFSGRVRRAPGRSAEVSALGRVGSGPRSEPRDNISTYATLAISCTPGSVTAAPAREQLLADGAERTTALLHYWLVQPVVTKMSHPPWY